MPSTYKGLTPGTRVPGLREILTHPLGPTHWQLNWWQRSGLIDLERSRDRYAAPITEEQQRRLIEMARLIAAGFKARRASQLLDEGTVQRDGKRVIPVAPGITIIVEPPDKVDA